MERKYILSADKALMKLRRMAYEVIERNSSEKQLILAGIKGNGYAIAQMLISILDDISSFKVDLLLVDIDKLNPLVCQLENQNEIKYLTFFWDFFYPRRIDLDSATNLRFTDEELFNGYYSEVTCKNVKDKKLLYILKKIRNTKYIS